jgi:ribosomal protein S18 acetylase RimI-like enzyme
VPVQQVNTHDEIQRYIEFADEVYRDLPSWVPSDTHHLTELLSGESGFAAQSRVQPFWVDHAGRILATVTAVRDQEYDRRWQEQMGHLLFFEALPDEEAAVAELWQAACGWLAEHGANAARVSLLPGWQLPLTIDAYDAVPTFFHTYNPPYYHSYIKNGGFWTEHGVVQYQVAFTDDLASRYRAMVERATRDGVTFRAFDLESPVDNETFTAICNETFRAHWGFMPLPTAVMAGLTTGLKDVLVADFTAFAEVDGELAGFVYSAPDLNQVFHAMRGRSIEDHLPEFQQRLGAIDHGVLLVIGVRERYRGRGLNLALAARSYLAMIDRGYRLASYTVVLDDNWRSRRTAEKLGARVTRNFNVYRTDFRPLQGPADAVARPAHRT